MKFTVAVAVLIAGLGATTAAHAATVNYTLYMTEADKTIAPTLAGKTYTRMFWVEGFTNVSGGLPFIGGVTLNSNEGDTVNITVINQTQESHDFEVKGSGVAKVTIAAGASAFVALPTTLKAGDYIYYDSSTDAQTKQLNRAVGMYGALVVRPAGQIAGGAGNLWAGGPAYKYDFTWVLSDFDKLWNQADKNKVAAPTAYKATYAFINGDFGHGSFKNASVSPKQKVGDTIAIRIVNPGIIAHPIHFHGYHGEVWRVDNVQQTRILEKDVIDVGPMQTVDLIFHINQKGMYIIHDHTGMMVTQDGIYAEGMVGIFDTCTKEGGLVSACDKFCPTPSIGVPNC